MVDQIKAAGELVTALFQAVEHGQNQISSVPGLLKQVIREDAWRQYALPHSSVVHRYQTFSEFVEDWLGISIEDLKAICTSRADNEALDLLDQINTNPLGVNQYTEGHYIVMTHNEQGNSNTYALRKLRKDRPDLHAMVISGDISPHSAMVKAGFRCKQFTIVLDPDKAARAIKRHFNESQCKQIVELLEGEG